MKPTNEKKKNRGILIILLFLAFILFLTIGILRQPAKSFTLKYISNTVVIFAVLYINVLLLVAFLVLLFRNITKIIHDRSQKKPGSKFSTRLITIFMFLTLVPTLFLFFIASDLISTNVDQWFSQPVEVINQNSSKIINEVLSETMSRVRSLTKQLSELVYDENLLESFDDMKLRIKKYLKERDIDIAHIFFKGDSKQYIVTLDPVLEKLQLDVPRHQLESAFKNNEFQHQEYRNDRIIVSVGYPIYRSTDLKTEPIGVIVCSEILAENLSFLIQQSQHFYNDYVETKKQKVNIKSTNILLLSMITLILLFSATWLGLRLARDITGPIQRLVEGTQQISAGNLSYRVDIDAGDELSLLVDSFNRMSEDLLISQKKYEESNLQLMDSHKVLEEQYHYIETILSNIPAGIISVNSEGTISTINEAAADMLELELESLLNIKFKTAFRAKLFSDFRKVFTAVNSKKKQQSQVVELHFTYEVKKIAIICSPLQDSDNKYIGLVIVMEDLTELSQAQKMAAWREVARRIAHEIKNPLTPIQLSAQRLLKKAGESDRDDKLVKLIEECSESILDEVFTLKKLVDEFSLFARMPEVKLAKHELNSIIETAVHPYQEAANDLQIDLDLHEVPSLMLDPEQMKRAVRNLIDNSLEAMASSNKKQIKIKTLNLDSKAVELMISDTGKGIPLNDLDKIFVPYFSSKKKGTGLGLAIVKKIVDEHHGKIAVKGNSPGGTTFSIELPIGV